MRTLYSVTLGLCEHCETLLDLRNMPGDSLNAEWRCRKCDGILTHRSFGYEVDGQENNGRDKWKKTRWVTSLDGEELVWTDKEVMLVHLL